MNDTAAKDHLYVLLLCNHVKEV